MVKNHILKIKKFFKGLQPLFPAIIDVKSAKKSKNVILTGVCEKTAGKRPNDLENRVFRPEFTPEGSPKRI